MTSAATDQPFPAFVFSNDPESPTRGVQLVTLDDIAADGVLIEVEWSSVNFKDGLATTISGKVARLSPIIPGIDLAGRIVADGEGFTAGQLVLAHG